MATLSLSYPNARARLANITSVAAASIVSRHASHGRMIIPPFTDYRWRARALLLSPFLSFFQSCLCLCCCFHSCLFRGLFLFPFCAGVTASLLWAGRVERLRFFRDQSREKFRQRYLYRRYCWSRGQLQKNGGILMPIVTSCSHECLWLCHLFTRPCFKAYYHDINACHVYGTDS